MAFCFYDPTFGFSWTDLSVRLICWNALCSSCAMHRGDIVDSSSEVVFDQQPSPTPTLLGHHAFTIILVKYFFTGVIEAFTTG